MSINIDHIVIGADTLSQGAAYVKQALGVDIPFGGVHQKMGTHNHLMQLGNDIFLEVIAINPEIDPPDAPRWYGLDDPFVRHRIRKHPCLLGWVVNTDNINRFLKQAQFSFGKPEIISRGNLKWNFGLPEDGRLLAGGMVPYVMEWHTSPHPSRGMADFKCVFTGLDIYHPHPSWLKSVLKSVSLEKNKVKIIPLPADTAPYLVAHIQTPTGEKQLRS